MPAKPASVTATCAAVLSASLGSIEAISGNAALKIKPNPRRYRARHTPFSNAVSLAVNCESVDYFWEAGRKWRATAPRRALIALGPQRSLLTFLACSGAPVSAVGAVLEPLLERFVSDHESEALGGGGFLRAFQVEG